jgi:ribosomal-protein-alanine N-acetyltransferase
MAFPSPAHVETERLVATMPPPTDASRLVAYFVRNRSHLAPWEPLRSAEFYTESYWASRLADNRRELTDDRSLRLVLFERGDPNRPVAGVVNFTSIVRGSFCACQLGYSLDRALEGRGLMHEALSATIPYVFEELGLHRIQASYMPHNQRSARLLSRLDFVIEGLARDYLYIDGQWRDHVLTSRTNPTWTPER